VCPIQQGPGIGLPEESARFAGEALQLLDKWKEWLEKDRECKWEAVNSDQLMQNGSVISNNGRTIVLSLSDLNATAICMSKAHTFCEIYGQLPTSGVLLGWLQSLDASGGAIISTVLSLLMTMDCGILNSNGGIREVGAILNQLHPDPTAAPSVPRVTSPSTSRKITRSTTSSESPKRGKKRAVETRAKSGSKPTKPPVGKKRKAPKKKKRKHAKR